MWLVDPQTREPLPAMSKGDNWPPKPLPIYADLDYPIRFRRQAMTDEPQPTPEEIELEKAKEAAAVPAEHIPDAEGLPDDVRDGEVVDADTVTITGDDLVVTEDDGEP